MDEPPGAGGGIFDRPGSGMMDFGPLAGIALVSLGAELAERGLTNLYARLAL